MQVKVWISGFIHIILRPGPEKLKTGSKKKLWVYNLIIFIKKPLRVIWIFHINEYQFLVKPPEVLEILLNLGLKF